MLVIFDGLLLFVFQFVTLCLYRVAKKTHGTVDTVDFSELALINSYLFHLAG